MPIKIQGYDNKLKIYTIPIRIHFVGHAHFMAVTDTQYKRKIIKIKVVCVRLTSVKMWELEKFWAILKCVWVESVIA